MDGKQRIQRPPTAVVQTADRRDEPAARQGLPITPAASPMQRLRAAPVVQARAAGDLPGDLQAGIEAISGVSMAGVSVRHGSSEPARIGALAFARGDEIHLGPGQAHHLPHEAWHVAQQRQGRVRPDSTIDGMAVNTDSGLEREADVMGARAAQMATTLPRTEAPPAAQAVAQRQPVIQRKDFTKKYSDSSFQLSSTSKEAIYMIYNVKTDLTEYVGKTSQGVPTRFNQHKSSKGLDADYAIQQLTSGTWTPFETATHEQYYLHEGGGKKFLMNKINALSEAKWTWFSAPTGQPHNKNQETRLTSGHF